jgi:hypothetical protein
MAFLSLLLDVYLFELAFQPQLIIEDLSGKNLISCGRRREMNLGYRLTPGIYPSDASLSSLTP